MRRVAQVPVTASVDAIVDASAAAQKERATHICLDCGYIYYLPTAFAEQPKSYEWCGWHPIAKCTHIHDPTPPSQPPVRRAQVALCRV